MSEKSDIKLDIHALKESSAASLHSIKEEDLTAEGGFDEQRTKNLVWKMDRNIIPFLSLLYL